MLGYAEREGVRAPSPSEAIHRIVEDYLDRGFHYWVFDLVELGFKELEYRVGRGASGK